MPNSLRFPAGPIPDRIHQSHSARAGHQTLLCQQRSLPESSDWALANRSGEVCDSGVLANSIKNIERIEPYAFAFRAVEVIDPSKSASNGRIDKRATVCLPRLFAAELEMAPRVHASGHQLLACFREPYTSQARLRIPSRRHHATSIAQNQICVPAWQLRVCGLS